MIRFFPLTDSCRDFLNSSNNDFFWNVQLSISALTAVSTGLVVVLKTFRVPDKGSKDVLSLVCANVFPVLLDLPIGYLVRKD